jgi:hypothetical protein
MGEGGKRAVLFTSPDGRGTLVPMLCVGTLLATLRVAPGRRRRRGGGEVTTPSIVTRKKMVRWKRTLQAERIIVVHHFIIRIIVQTVGEGRRGRV